MSVIRDIKSAFGALIKRSYSLATGNGFVLFPVEAVRAMERKKIRFDRAQWRRWYRANQKYQRQLRAVRGIRIDPNQSSLRREDVR